MGAMPGDDDILLRDAGVVGGEVPQLVPQDRSAQAQPQIVLGGARYSRIEQAEARVSGQPAAGEITEGARLELVAPRVGDDVHDRPQASTVLGLVTGFLHFNRLDEIVGEIGG